MKPTQALQPIATQALEAIHQHRLLTTSQVRDLLLSRRRIRTAQRLLAELAERGLLDVVGVSRAPRPGRQERAWFVTELGAEVVEVVPGRNDMRHRVLTFEMASSSLQAHTLAVNDVGLAFCRAAAQRDHEFSPLAWLHEVPHQLDTGRRNPRMVIPDAVLRYWIRTSRQSATLHYRFLELDRSHVLVETLVQRLVRYARLQKVWGEQRQRGDGPEDMAWPSLYRAFPHVMVIVANPERSDPQRRIDNLIALAGSEPELMQQPGAPEFFFALHEDLVKLGPFAPIFQTLRDPRYVNWLGESVADLAAQITPAA